MKCSISADGILGVSYSDWFVRLQGLGIRLFNSDPFCVVWGGSIIYIIYTVQLECGVEKGEESADAGVLRILTSRFAF